MRVYILREHHWDWSTTLGVYSEEGMNRHKQTLIAEACNKRAAVVAERIVKILSLKTKRRELCLKDQNEMVPIERALKAGEDRGAYKLYHKERKAILKEIDRLNSQIWLEEGENEKLARLEGDALISRFFPDLEFQEHEVLD